MEDISDADGLGAALGISIPLPSFDPRRLRRNDRGSISSQGQRSPDEPRHDSEDGAMIVDSQQPRSRLSL